MATIYAEDLLKSSDREKSSSFSDVVQGSVAGATVGFIGGTLYAFFYKKKYLPSIIIGSVAGFVVSGIFLVQK